MPLPTSPENIGSSETLDNAPYASQLVQVNPKIPHINLIFDSMQDLILEKVRPPPKLNPNTQSDYFPRMTTREGGP